MPSKKQFLKAVCWYSLTAFGGPQVHYSMMLKLFVQKRKDITEEELLEIISFCNLLPGASSTQTISLIAYKYGGTALALLTLLIWITPACLCMGLAALLLFNLPSTYTIQQVCSFLPAMSIGFLVFTTQKLFSVSVKNTITQIISIIAAILTFLYFKSPWIFPIVLIVAGISTNFSKKRIPDNPQPKAKMKWINLYVFVLLFAFIGYLSEWGTTHHWKNRKLINLIENNYRFGSMVFGGGDVLMPMMYEQYVARPASNKIVQSGRDVLKMKKEHFFIGAGLVKAVPGPVFSIGAFTGGALMSGQSWQVQVCGVLLGGLSIFLPSILLVLFFYPVWNNLKKYAIIYRSLEGIHAAITGIMAGAIIYLMVEVWQQYWPNEAMLTVQFSAILLAFIAIKKTRIPMPIMVLVYVLFGVITLL